MVIEKIPKQIYLLLMKIQIKYLKYNHNYKIIKYK
jgi:hypothetical protein